MLSRICKILGKDNQKFVLVGLAVQLFIVKER